MERLGRCIRELADWELAREWELLVPWLEKEVLRVCTEESSCDSDKDCESDLELAWSDSAEAACRKKGRLLEGLSASLGSRLLALARRLLE